MVHFSFTLTGFVLLLISQSDLNLRQLFQDNTKTERFETRGKFMQLTLGVLVTYWGVLICVHIFFAVLSVVVRLCTYACMCCSLN